MKSRTAAALLSGLGVVGGGALLALPGQAGAAPAAAVVDSTVPDDDAPDTTTADDETADGTESTTTDETTTDETTTDESETAATDSAAATTDRTSRIEEVLQPLVEDGTLTEEQLAAVVDALDDVRIGAFGPPTRIALLDADTLTETLGLSIDELREALADGQTVAEVAEAQNVAIDDLVAALVAAATERIDAAVADGRLTQEEATTLTEELTERITERLESTIPLGGPSFNEGGRGSGRHNGESGRFDQTGPHGQGGPQSQSGPMPQGGPQGQGGQMGPGGNGGPGMPGDAPSVGGGSSQSDAPSTVESSDATTA